MWEVVFWVVIVLLFIASFVGLALPIIPSALMLWGGFLLYHFGINNEALSWVFWVVMSLFTVILVASDVVANSYFVKKYGGSKWGERIAGVAVIVGSFIFPPFGLLLIPFLAVFVTEMVQKKTAKEACFASIGSLVGFLSGTVAKVVLQLFMIVWFLVDTLLL